MSQSRERTFNQEMKEAQEYWLRSLSRQIGESGLRPDSPRPAHYSPRTATLEIVLPDSAFQKLYRLTNSSPFLVYAALLAALKVCLHKYTGSETVVVGSPSRLSGNGEREIGNALSIVNAVHGQMSFREILMQVRESLIEAYARQHYPFTRLVTDFGLDKTEHKCPLFDIALVLSNIHHELPEVRNDITLTFRHSTEGLSGVLEYRPALFRAESIRRFAGHFLRLMDAALENVNARVRELEMLTEAERYQLLFEFNDTTTPYTQGQAIHRLFEAQVERTPDATALFFEGEKLTYKELNERANHLAHHLRGLGVRAESLVGIYMESSLELIVGLMAVLKAGGAYVPLDPSYPRERIVFMIRDAQLPLLLTEHRLVENLKEYQGRLVCLDTDWDLITRETSGANLPDGAGADNLAYVIYTSGSTGAPKGVMVEHQGVCNLAEAQSQAFGVGPESRVIKFASISFDASVSEMFMALTTGAILCLSSRSTIFSGTPLIHLLRTQSITTATIPPAMLSVLPVEELPELRTIISAGEACPPEIAKRWSEGRRFFNAYGPTETTVCASLAEVCPQLLKDYQSVPIGRPLANTKIHLLDSFFKPVPLGAAGELCVGGVGLARGYLNQPALTAEKFVPHPFSAEPGARLYRTGDLARYLRDGQVEFLGRLDRQVKVRGYRVEPNEIENLLRQRQEVRDAVVVARQDRLGNACLVTYVVPEPGSVESINDWQTALREKLPEYMIPSAFVILRELPLTPNGKVDKRALPAPDWLRSEKRADFVAPSTPVEKKLAEIWSELLGIQKTGTGERIVVSIHDHFFDLGGHSLLAVRMFSKIREAFGVELPLKLIFTSAPTISGLAGAIDRHLVEMADAEEFASVLRELDGLSDGEIRHLLESEETLAQPDQPSEGAVS
jgi:amino acid adenylation domain-containing protein